MNQTNTYIGLRYLLRGRNKTRYATSKIVINDNI
jgi:hypothetical protein